MFVTELPDLSTSNLTTPDNPAGNNTYSLFVKWTVQSYGAEMASHYYYIVYYRISSTTARRLKRQASIDWITTNHRIPHVYGITVLNYTLTGLMYNTAYDIMLVPYRTVDGRSERGVEISILNKKTACDC